MRSRLEKYIYMTPIRPDLVVYQEEYRVEKWPGMKIEDMYYLESGARGR